MALRFLADHYPNQTPQVACHPALEEFRTLLGRFCVLEGEFAPHAMFSQMSKTERATLISTSIITCGSSRYRLEGICPAPNLDEQRRPGGACRPS
jgi:hypothetical protein